MNGKACDTALGPLSARISTFATEGHQSRRACLEICIQTTHLQALPVTSKSFSSLLSDPQYVYLVLVRSKKKKPVQFAW